MQTDQAKGPLQKKLKDFDIQRAENGEGVFLFLSKNLVIDSFDVVSGTLDRNNFADKARLRCKITTRAYLNDPDNDCNNNYNEYIAAKLRKRYVDVNIECEDEICRIRFEEEHDLPA
jgi:hypothetical protein